MRSMMNDVVTLVKSDGRQFADIPANVQPKMIFIDDGKIPIEEGDHIERLLPNGLLERYLVLDRGFFGASGGFKDHYQIQVRKVTAIPRDPVAQTTIYNLHGANSRVNIQSHDQSTNVVTVSPTDLFAELRKALSDGFPTRASARHSSAKSLNSKLRKEVRHTQTGTRNSWPWPLTT